MHPRTLGEFDVPLLSPAAAVCTTHDVYADALDGTRIMSATIKDNIVFHYAYDEEFYNLVLDGVCHPPHENIQR